MATIKEFKAFLPEVNWFNRLLSGDGTELFALRYKLEIRGKKDIESGCVDKVEEVLSVLINNRRFDYQQNPAIYVYQQETLGKISSGICAMTAVKDYLHGEILGHEHTLQEHEERLLSYRLNIGMEGAPVLLTYQPLTGIDEIISSITLKSPSFAYQEGEIAHRLWRISEDAMIQHLKDVFQEIQIAYVGDGHHRLAAAAKMQGAENEYMLGLYVSTDQLSVSGFDRLIFPGQEIIQSDFFEFLEKLFFVSAIPGNVCYQPDRLHRIGLCYHGIWYQLDLKDFTNNVLDLPDVVILQEMILSPVFGITDPRTDERLFCYPNQDISEMLEDASCSSEAIIFTLYPIGVDQLIDCAQQSKALPPKSSFIEPKVPYGLLMNPGALLKQFKISGL
ncbi:DUF1015 family protein [Pedobacter frigidisoli]|uniref:DUF1015 family protein n=1 Tax=Pedobacter frigidisoli TaxID=2530455 RepID=UPI00292F2443|nr:DUF1015 family protein [Pedobacter frigidisoli]